MRLPVDPALLSLPHAELEARRLRQVETLLASSDAAAAGAARVVLDELELASVHRGAEPERADPLDLLFVTVGSQADAPALAVVASPARYVVLLHSDETARFAVEVVERLSLGASEATALNVGDGKDPSRLYREVRDQWVRRGRPERVGVDFTGGLKTMTAALHAASLILPGARSSYIDSNQLRLHGAPFWHQQRRILFQHPALVFGDLRRATARDLLADGRYGPAAAAWKEVHDVTGDPADRLRHALAGAFDAVDRLDPEAPARLDELRKLIDRERSQGRLEPDDTVGRLDGDLAALSEGAARVAGLLGGERGADPAADLAKLRDDRFLELIALLVATAERRLAEGQADVAVLLAYRAMEAVPQRRLAVLAGVDVGDIRWDALAAAQDTTVDALVSAYNRVVGKEHRLDRDQLPPRLARVASYALLAVVFPDDLARSDLVEKIAGLGQLRNASLLGHGLRRVDPRQAGRLLDETRSLVDALLQREGLAPDARRALYARHRLPPVREG